MNKIIKLIAFTAVFSTGILTTQLSFANAGISDSSIAGGIAAGVAAGIAAGTAAGVAASVPASTGTASGGTTGTGDSKK